LKVIPSGKVTTVLFTGGVARALGLSFWGRRTAISKPVGELASVPVGVASTEGSKRGTSQSVVLPGWV
jgi:hypothetical protein